MTTGLVPVRNGAELPASLVASVWYALQRAAPLDVLLAVHVARTREPAADGFGAALYAVGLLERDGTMHDAVRDVVLSAAVGTGPDLRLTHPVAE